MTKSLTGRKSKDIDFAVDRLLALGDLSLLNEERGEQKPLATVKRLSQRHRTLAQYIVRGYTNEECAALLGYSISRISILRSDPAFKNLLAIYQAEQENLHENVDKKAIGILEETLDIIADRLEDDPDKLSVGQLLEVVTTIGDRVGFAPETKKAGETNINVTIAAQMEAGRARVERMRNAQTIDVIPNKESSDD